MGILNVTPDSFSDGGRFSDPVVARDHAVQMVEAGADWIDIGGESTRPGSQRVPADVQIARVAPVLAAVRSRVSVPISIDTTLASVARAALDGGADAVNDISAGQDDAGMFPLVAERDVPIILMHMQGEPATMQNDPHYKDAMLEVCGFLGERMRAAQNAGIARESLLVDPGIGFGKTIDHNLELLRRLGELVELGRPIVIGTSRKRFIGTITGESDASRPFGTAATVAWALANGASVVRVHDVGPMSQVTRMVGAIQTGKPIFFA
jgi:dihydropteroate synthase